IAEGHVATLERQQSLIHLGINPDRSSLACTRHNYHSVVTIYKTILEIATGVFKQSPKSRELRHFWYLLMSTRHDPERAFCRGYANGAPHRLGQVSLM